jgi:hypothetical protein
MTTKKVTKNTVVIYAILKIPIISSLFTTKIFKSLQTIDLFQCGRLKELGSDTVVMTVNMQREI